MDAWGVALSACDQLFALGEFFDTKTLCAFAFVALRHLLECYSCRHRQS